jgi:hypothetical protein
MGHTELFERAERRSCRAPDVVAAALEAIEFLDNGERDDDVGLGEFEDAGRSAISTDVSMTSRAFADDMTATTPVPRGRGAGVAASAEGSRSVIVTPQWMPRTAGCDRLFILNKTCVARLLDGVVDVDGPFDQVFFGLKRQ